MRKVLQPEKPVTQHKKTNREGEEGAKTPSSVTKRKENAIRETADIKNEGQSRNVTNLNTGPSNDNYSSYLSAKNEKESESKNARRSPYHRNYSHNRKKNVELKRLNQ